MLMTLHKDPRAIPGQTKVLFPLQQDEDGYPPVASETIWVKVKDGKVIIDNIPFFIRGIALGDIISVELEENHWRFLDVVERSGHSTIRILVSDPSQASQIGKELVALGCTWESGHIPQLIAVDIPPDKKEEVRDYLDRGEEMGRFEDEEGLVWW